jgi:hypothetical protein
MGIHASREEVIEEHGEPGATDWADNPVLAIVKDDPSLDVVHESLGIVNPACITARENWLTRYAKILAPHLRDGRPTRVFTYATGNLSDVFGTFHTTAEGPCLLPPGLEWPTCRECGEQMAFIGQLDFRDAPLEVTFPGRALAFHYCVACLSEDEGRYSLVWLENEARWIGAGGRKPREVQLGTAWDAIDYPWPFDEETKSCLPDEIASAHPRFSEERSLYLVFTCYGTKVGGHIFWIQYEDIPTDRRGKSMIYIGQFLGHDDAELGDSGIAYIFYSLETHETKLRMQCF